MHHHSSFCRPWASILATVFTIAALGCTEKAGSVDGSGGATSSGGKASGGDARGSGGQAGTGGGVGTGGAAMTGGSASGGSSSSGGATAATGGRSTVGQGGSAGTSAAGGATGGGGMGGASTARASGGSAGSGFGGAGSGGTTSGGTGQGGRTTGGTTGTTSGGTTGTTSGGTTGTTSGGTTGTTSGGSTGETTRSAGCGTTSPPKTGKYSITAASLNRTYVIDVPTNYDPNKAYKLLFAWHPNGGNAQSIADTDGGYYGIKPIANNTTVFVAGDGIDAGWANTNDRDIAFVKAMLDRFFGQLCIDKSRIFSTGWSYGGMFSYAIGCAMGDVFRAIAPTSGALMSGCAEGTHPIAMWGAHGTNDTLVNISSGRSARDVFLTRNHCSKTASAPDANKCVSYEGCDSGYPVVWCEWSGGHLYPPFGAAETWKFFSQF